MRVNMHEAKSQLSRLARLARDGEQVVICNAGRPWVYLLPYRERIERRRPGGLEGEIEVPPDFDREDDEIISAFENSRLFPDEE